MALDAGSRLGPYEIVAPLGAGGMGEVYRARDTRLHRDVALKILPASVTAEDRHARFEAEARAAALLNHPNILAVFDVGRAPLPGGGPDVPFIVSELLEGATLAERLREGPPPLRKTLEYAVQIARGLAAAHARDVVHRDLKPANVFVTTDGRVKILDFGLAKLLGPPQGGSETTVTGARLGPTDVSAAPTIPLGTTPGMAFGTVGYMAPEQVRGQVVDHRADIFAFGVLLYEMATGERAFERETPPETLTAILREDVPHVPLVDRHTPPGLTRIIRRCAEKDPAARFQSALDLAFALEALDSGSGSGTSPTVQGRRPLAREVVAWTTAATAVVAAVTLGLWPARSAPATPDGPPIRFTLAPPTQGDGIALAAVPAVSPDGRRVAYVGGGIWVHALDEPQPRRVDAFGGGQALFWSPNGEALGFTAGAMVRTVDVAGSSPRTVCELPTAFVRGGTWSIDDVIVIGSAGGGLMRCAPGGGTATRLTQLDAERQDSGHYAPSFLPDGKRLFYWAQPSRSVRLVSVDGGSSTDLLTADSPAHYVEPGYLVFARQGSLFAQPFDAATATLSGNPVAIVDRVLSDESLPLGSAFGVSTNGILVYRTGAARELSQLTWVDRFGRGTDTVGQPGLNSNPNLSPDGRRVALERAEGPGRPRDIWVVDLARNVMTRFTFDEADESHPIWSPDGEWLAFASDRSGLSNIYRKRANGGGADELILKTASIVPVSWTPDGQSILYQRQASPLGLGVLALGPSPTATLLDPGRTQIIDRWGQVSPDGKWVAYGSNESGPYQVYVQSFPSPDRGKWQISGAGGAYPRWAAQGRELLYQSGTRLYSVSVGGAAVPEFGEPKLLFEAKVLFGGANAAGREHQYAVSADGRRLLVNTPIGTSSPSPLTVAVNWQSMVKP